MAGAYGEVVDLRELDDLLKKAPRTRVYGERPIYENRWVDVVKVDIAPPGDRRFEHHVVRLQTVAALAVVVDDAVLMLGRHRWPVGAYGWELPGGIVNPKEDGVTAVAREVLEETGYEARGRIRRLANFQPMPGMVDTPHEVYLARAAEHVGDPTDAEEAGVIAWVPLRLLSEMVATGRVASSGSLVGVLAVLAGIESDSDALKPSA